MIPSSRSWSDKYPFKYGPFVLKSSLTQTQTNAHNTKSHCWKMYDVTSLITLISWYTCSAFWDSVYSLKHRYFSTTEEMRHWDVFHHPHKLRGSKIYHEWIVNHYQAIGYYPWYHIKECRVTQVYNMLQVNTFNIHHLYETSLYFLCRICV